MTSYRERQIRKHVSAQLDAVQRVLAEEYEPEMPSAVTFLVRAALDSCASQLTWCTLTEADRPLQMRLARMQAELPPALE